MNGDPCWRCDKCGSEMHTAHFAHGKLIYEGCYFCQKRERAESRREEQNNARALQSLIVRE